MKDNEMTCAIAASRPKRKLPSGNSRPELLLILPDDLVDAPPIVARDVAANPEDDGLLWEELGDLAYHPQFNRRCIHEVMVLSGLSFDEVLRLSRECAWHVGQRLNLKPARSLDDHRAAVRRLIEDIASSRHVLIETTAWGSYPGFDWIVLAMKRQHEAHVLVEDHILGGLCMRCGLDLDCIRDELRGPLKRAA